MYGNLQGMCLFFCISWCVCMYVCDSLYVVHWTFFVSVVLQLFFFEFMTSVAWWRRGTVTHDEILLTRFNSLVPETCDWPMVEFWAWRECHPSHWLHQFKRFRNLVNVMAMHSQSMPKLLFSLILMDACDTDTLVTCWKRAVALHGRNKSLESSYAMLMQQNRR